MVIQNELPLTRQDRINCPNKAAKSKPPLTRQDIITAPERTVENLLPLTWPYKINCPCQDQTIELALNRLYSIQFP